MLMTWFFREEPIRHDLHLKTALIMSSHRECVCLKSVNKYRSERGGKRDGVSIQKKRDKSSVRDDWKPAVTSYTLSKSFGSYFFLLAFCPPPPVL